MLRRKLLIYLGPLVVMLLITAVAAVALLQGVLRDMHHIHDESWQAVEDVSSLNLAINSVEIELYELQVGSERHLDRLIDSLEQVRSLFERLGGHYLCTDSAGGPLYERLVAHLPEFERHAGALATARDPDLVRLHTESALASTVALQHATLPLSRYVRDHAQEEQEALARTFGRLVLGLGLVFLVVINISVMVLLRTAWVIVRPVDKLIEATEALGREQFDFRVQLDQHDEFDQLAQAYNGLAGRLQANEQRRMEVLSQAALALNHELNNAIAIIELQLQLLGRQANGNPAFANCLRQIREGLGRMTRTVSDLKSIRRIVLTDYLPGTKMLDLRRSIAEDAEQRTEKAAKGSKRD